MYASLARIGLRHPRLVMVCVTILTALTGWLAWGTPSHVGLGGFQVRGSQSAAANAKLGRALGHEAEPSLQVVIRGGVPVSSGVYRIALRTIVSQLRTRPAVAAVRRDGHSPDHHTVVLGAFLKGSSSSRERAAAQIESELDPGPLSVSFAGSSPTLLEARQKAGHDLGRLELLVLPLCLLILVLTVGMRLAAGPVLVAALGACSSLVALRLFEGPAATSLAGAAPAAAGALAIGLESALGFSGRYREESWTFGRGADAMRRSAEHIGPAIVAASLAAAAVLACAWILPVGYARSIAVAGLVAVPLAGLASLVVMPALLTLTDQNDRATPRRAVRGPVASAQGPWYRFAAFWTRPSRMAVGTAVALCLLLAVVSSQAFRLDSISFSASELPSDSQARVAARRLDVALGPGAQAPLLGVSEGAPSQLGPYAKGLRRLTGVVRTKLSPAGRKHSLVSIQARPRPGSLPAQGVVGEVRAGSLDLGVQVGGTSARTRDAAAAIGSWLVLALLAALAVGGALLAWVGGGIRRAAATAVLAFVPAAAAAGVLALVFQDGRLSPLLHYSPQGAPHLAAAITALSALVAISVGRSAFLLGSVRHDAKLAAGPRWAMARALALTAPACAATSLIVVAAAGAMVAVDLLPVKEFGLALAVGALLDFIVLRLIALPLLAHPEGERLRLRHE